MRGAGPSRPLCRLQYHSGRSRDLCGALRALPSDLTARGILLVGYSLGGNMLLKFLAEFALEFPVRGAVSVSAPIDLSASSHRFLDPRNVVYHWNLLRNMKRESLAEGSHVSADERSAIGSVRSILDFDERFVAPRNGYADAAEYYAANMARQFLAQIRVPTLLVQSLDDPWIPPDAYTSYPWRDNPMLCPVFPAPPSLPQAGVKRRAPQNDSTTGHLVHSVTGREILTIPSHGFTGCGRRDTRARFE